MTVIHNDAKDSPLKNHKNEYMLKGKLEADLKEAMKAGQALRVSVLRFLLAAVKNREIELKPTGKELADEDVTVVITKQVKQHRESIEAYEKGGRPELSEKEKAELDLLKSYLPEQVGEEEITVIVREAITAGAVDLGSIMKAIMPKVKGRADGSVVRGIVEKLLDNR